MRRGASTAALGTTICALIFIVVMAVGVAQLAYHRQQAHIGTDAASLAGIPELMDLRPLYDGPFLSDAASANSMTEAEFLSMLRNEQAATARDLAVSFAEENSVDGSSIVLDRNDANLPDGDIVIGWLDTPEDRDAVSDAESSDGLYPGEGSYNTISVRETRSDAEGNSLSLWMAAQVGFDDIVLTVQSRATVDQRLLGVRPIAPLTDGAGDPIPRTNVPMLPLFVMPDVGDELDHTDPTTPNIAHLWWSKGTLDATGMNFFDEFVVDCRTGEALPGSDYIAELVIRIPATGSTGPAPTEPESRDGGLAFFGTETLDDAALSRLAVEGYRAEDFDTVGGEIRLSDTGTFLADAAFELTGTQINDLKDSLNSIIGMPRIIPLCLQNSPSQCQVYGFAAGSVVRVDEDTAMADGSLLVHIQPCVMQTPTAIVGATTLRNPWIGKAVLSR